MPSSQNNEVVLLYWRDPEPSQRRAAQLAEFMGATAKLIDLAGILPGLDASPVGACAMVTAGTLARALEAFPALTPGVLTNLGTDLMVYGFSPNPAHGRLLRGLTDGELFGVKTLEQKESHFKVEGPRELCRQFSGLSIPSSNPEFDLAFVEESGRPALGGIIRVGGRPFYVSRTRSGKRLLLLACGEIADLDEQIPREVSIVTYFSRLAPAMMFLKQALGRTLWHNDTPGACFIVDDPLLRPRYGFLDYEQLLKAMERHRFSASVAFIPWNHRRSKSGTVDLFKRRSQRLSLCVHGCDHTSREFGATQYPALWERAHKGLHRMRCHEQRTGLGFDEVMVFPQGVFSTEAIRALQSCGYLAAVNSTAYATDAATAPRLRDLLEGAVTAYSNFPLFTRRYPEDKAALAFDLFVGKAALLVEHHQFFRDGYGALDEIVTWLNAKEERLEWARLSEICRKACVKREAGDGRTHLRFLTDRFVFSNDTSSRREYVLIRRQPEESPRPSVTINGSGADCGQNGESLEIPVELAAGQMVEVNIRRPVTAAPISRTDTRPVRVFIRRMLSEFRDDHIHRNLFLTQLAAGVRNRLVGRK